MTPDIDQAILRAGWDDRTLADMLFMPVAMLRSRRYHLTGPIPRPPRPPVVRKYRHAQPSSEWTPEQDQFLTKAYANNMTFEDIARQMGRTKNSVLSRSRRLRGVK